MSIKDIKLKKGMSRDEVNDLIGEWLTLEDEIYLGNKYKHNWRCKCGNVFKKTWQHIKYYNQINCGCIEYNKTEQRYKYEVERDGDYEYIRSYRRGDRLPNGKLIKRPYIQIKHKYCGNVYEIRFDVFVNGEKRCPKCCQKYENSFAYYIEQELNEPLEKYWDFEKNTVNPYYISRSSHNKIWIKCTKTNYHENYKTMSSLFTNGKRCPYCVNQKIHPLDSFGYHNFDKAQSWHPDNKISPFRVAPNSGKKYKFICPECSYVWCAKLNYISNRSWCPQCSASKGEKKIIDWLRPNNIEFIPQKKFDGLLGLNEGKLSYDFYLPEYNLLIEYQGEQHERFIKGFHASKEVFDKQQEHDRRKREYAKDNDIKLLEIWYWDFDNIEEILNEKFNI